MFLAAWRSGEQEITALHGGKFSLPGPYRMSRRPARERVMGKVAMEAGQRGKWGQVMQGLLKLIRDGVVQR